MKVTPWNIAKFWRRLMFPPDREDFYMDRVTLKADLPWEPWLHCGVWLSVAATMILGESGLYPPADSADVVWLLFGLISPPVGFFSVWALEYNPGKARYIALWTRMIADIGLSVAIVAYLCNRLMTGQLGTQSIMADMILFLSAWFTMTLVLRDVRFIAATEKLAALIHRDLRHPCRGGRVDDAGR
jgi:hypothetical protein